MYKYLGNDSPPYFYDKDYMITVESEHFGLKDTVRVLQSIDENGEIKMWENPRDRGPQREPKIYSSLIKFWNDWALLKDVSKMGTRDFFASMEIRKPRLRWYKEGKLIECNLEN